MTPAAYVKPIAADRRFRWSQTGHDGARLDHPRTACRNICLAQSRISVVALTGFDLRVGPLDQGPRWRQRAPAAPAPTIKSP
jgi:hypothetical protein